MTDQLRDRQIAIENRAFNIDMRLHLLTPPIGFWGNAVAAVCLVHLGQRELKWTDDLDGLCEKVLSEGKISERLTRVLTAWQHGGKLRPTAEQMLDIEDELDDIEQAIADIDARGGPVSLAALDWHRIKKAQAAAEDDDGAFAEETGGKDRR